MDGQQKSDFPIMPRRIEVANEVQLRVGRCEALDDLEKEYQLTGEHYKLERITQLLADQEARLWKEQSCGEHSEELEENESVSIRLCDNLGNLPVTTGQTTLMIPHCPTLEPDLTLDVKSASLRLPELTSPSLRITDPIRTPSQRLSHSFSLSHRLPQSLSPSHKLVQSTSPSHRLLPSSRSPISLRPLDSRSNRPLENTPKGHNMLVYDQTQPTRNLVESGTQTQQTLSVKPPNTLTLNQHNIVFKGQPSADFNERQPGKFSRRQRMLIGISQHFRVPVRRKIEMIDCQALAKISDSAVKTVPIIKSKPLKLPPLHVILKHKLSSILRDDR